MSIDDYIVQLESVIASSPAVSSYNITIDRKTNDIAFVSGVIELRETPPSGCMKAVNTA
ncbi:MAG: hypothetical protein HZA13_07940 [Nitrospirae bacterium]|nr:hypothetical protein [Nitrospirota bacterium]